MGVSMAIKVFIDGKEGTTGLKIFERFANRSDLEMLEISEEKREYIFELAKKTGCYDKYSKAVFGSFSSGTPSFFISF